MVVSLREVSFWYEAAPALQPALNAISLNVAEGEFVLLCGASGSGKSTLLRLCLGLVPQFSGGALRGEVTVLGRDPTRLPPRVMAASGVALLVQNPLEGFVADRVGEEVAFGPENLDLPPAEVDRRVRAALADVGMGDLERRRLRDLSAGQQQRVALAAALALEPQLLLLDEPTSNLDPHLAAEVLSLVSVLHRRTGITVILSEHRLDLAAPLASRVVALANGRCLADGPPRCTLADPALRDAGIPVPPASRAAVRLALSPPVPLTPGELAARLDPILRGHTSVTPVLAETGETEPPAAGGSASEPLRFEGVSFAFTSGTPVVQRVGFVVRAGEVVALMGPSGAGKSTLARLALGLLKPAVGSVTLCGVNTRSAPVSALANLGGLVLQNPLHQLLAARVDEELLLGLRHLPPAERATRVTQALEALEIGDLRHRHPLALSEGQRRRVALAAVLVRRPRVLVLDEPTLGQDERGRSALAAVIGRAARAGTAVLAISHDPEFVNDACSRVLLVRDGCLVADAPLQMAYDAPETLAEQGVPLAGVPATAMSLRQRGYPIQARTLDQLVAALEPRVRPGARP